MTIDELKIGEMYVLSGRRARLDKIERVAGGDSARFRPYDESCPYLQVTLSTGRKFEKSHVLLSNRYSPDTIGQIIETWEDRKARLKSERAEKDELKNATANLNQALEEAGFRVGYADGRFITIPGGVREIRKLASILASYEEESGSSELSDLLS